MLSSQNPLKNNFMNKIIALVALFGLSNIASANSDVIGLELEYRLRADGQAHYNTMWQRMQELGFSSELQVLPFKRAFRDFSKADDSCLFPTTKESLTISFPQFKAEDLIDSDSVDYVMLKVMTRQGDPIITSLEQLKGKKVAIWNGLDPKIYFKDLNVKVETTSDEAVRLKMLNSHRVDAILGFLPDTLLAADALGVKHPQHEGAYHYFDYNKVSMVCFNSPRNQQRIAEFNKALNKLKASGELKQILGPHATLTLPNEKN